MSPDKQCCGNCIHCHREGPECLICNDPESDAYGFEVFYTDWCDEYEVNDDADY